MKAQTRIAVGLLVIGMMAGVAAAQAGGVRANVPFDFGGAGKTLAAGQYTLWATSHEVRVISATEGRTVAIVLANQLSGRSAGENGRIIFRCYGQRCFLAEVWTPSKENGQLLFRTEAEVEAAKAGPERYFAVLGMKPLR